MSNSKKIVKEAEVVEEPEMTEEREVVEETSRQERSRAKVNKPLIAAGLIGLFVALIAIGFGAKTRIYVDHTGVHLSRTEQQTIDHQFEEVVTAVELESGNGRVEVKAGDELRLEAGYYVEEPEYRVEDGVLKIKFKEDWNDMRWSLGFNWFIDEHLTLTVPEKLLTRLEVENDNGSIRVETVDAAEMQIKNDNGSIWVGGLAADQLTVTNKNGRIELFDLTSETTEVRNNNGSIEGTNVSGRVTVDNDNGRIVFNGVDPAAYLWLKNDNGSIRVNDQRQSDRPYIQGDDEAANWLRATNDNGSIRVNTR